MINFAALDAAAGLPPTAKSISRLAAIHGKDAASWAFHQWSLRSKAKRKFENAEEMLLTSAGLEQASHEAIARYHASRFPIGELVADLTCGIGADLVALSLRGPAVGYEIDPITASYAAHNVKEVPIFQRDCLDVEWDFEYAFADPARRDGSGRIISPNAFLPNPATIAERMRELKIGGIKLSPMLSDAYLRNLSESLEFVSFGWECREALAWLGKESEPGVFAVKVEAGDRLGAGGFAESVDEPRGFIYESDPAAIRAHALPSLCVALNAVLLGDSNGYLTAQVAAPSPWVRRYKVIECGSFDVKRVRKLLKSLGGGPPEVKSRAKLDVVELRKRLTTEGSGHPIVLLYPVRKSIRFAIVVPA